MPDKMKPLVLRVMFPFRHPTTGMPDKIWINSGSHHSLFRHPTTGMPDKIRDRE